jgi:D-serine deaminase-like pyridoxal phosphate-dependent protein
MELKKPWIPGQARNDDTQAFVVLYWQRRHESRNGNRNRKEIASMKIAELKTPAFLFDLPKLKTNIRRMQERAVEQGVRLRPHVKTHKTAEIARLQVSDKASGITVSTLAEAHFFQKAGFDDITYAFPITPNKLDEAADLTRRLAHFHILIDQLATARAVETYGRDNHVCFSVLLKVDCGYHRAGVDPASPESIQLVDEIQSSRHMRFSGILTHAGHSYRCRNRKEVMAVARQERDVMVAFAARLKQSGIGCETVSVGSTPTAVHAPGWRGETEIRPGNYAFFDKFQADIGSCRLGEAAATVLTTVAAHYPQHNQLLIDAGALALSKDPGAVHIDDRVVYGAVRGHPGLRLFSISQEHGLINSEAPIAFNDFPVGSLMQIIPNHSCLTAALFDRYHVVEENRVINEWRPMRGW